MPSIDPASAALRAQDFHEALKETTSFGPKEVHFGKTLLIGKAATLAMHLKGLLYIDDLQGLTYAAAELGITGLELPSVLHELEEVDFVRLAKSGESIRRVDVRVPAFRSGYEELGARLADLTPSEVETAATYTLNGLLTAPMPEASLSAIGLDPTALAIMTDIMQSGQLLQVQPVGGQRLVYTPLAVDANPLTYLEWTKKYGDDVSNLLKVLSEHQGLPLGAKQLAGNAAFEDAVLTGVLQPVRITGTTGEQGFVFAPRGGLAPEQRVILDKARAILASVRYGQNFAAGRPVKYPRALLEYLRDHKRFRRGHPDLRTQYSLLVEKLIGRPVDEGGGRWNFELVDTEENLKALDVALDMLELGEAPAAYINLNAQRAILAPHGYLGPTSARPRLARSIGGSTETRADIVAKIADLTRGIVHG